LVQAGALRSKFEISELVRLVEEETCALESRNGVSRRTKNNLELRSRSQSMVLPPVLRFPARPQYLKSRGAGGDTQDHGLLDPRQASPDFAWTLCLSSSRPRDQTCDNQNSSSICCVCSANSFSDGRAT